MAAGRRRRAPPSVRAARVVRDRRALPGEAGGGSVAVASIGFHLTDRCQLDCQHCLRDPAQKPKDLEPALIRRVLAESKALYRTSHAIFTGGEPTLHPAFEEVVDAAVDLGMTWRMVSNGRRFDRTLEMLRARPERVKALFANFSLDGATEST